MAKKQTRRSVSIRGSTYERVRQHCDGTGISMSEFVEARVSEYFAGRMSVLRSVVPQVVRSNGMDDDARLSESEMHDAARFFTF